ncbi:NYN domain-containing protein [Alitabrizicola rongguiensis]|uniref:NYN domain-containing protein n=1 Tax=Alitabrizicola rongguiensis TaxID=2909234 RepID=UPI002103DA56|nr:NYN domain-containing protein [Tabrizicola rongguiensis]
MHTGSTASKNCADISIVIDAMDIAHSGKADTFLIASSDGDFAPLALRLREGGFRVIGMGRDAASRRFREMCSEFIALSEPAHTPAVDVPAPMPTAPQTPAERPQLTKLNRIDRAIHEVCRKHGGTSAHLLLTDLGNRLPQEQMVKRKETGRASWRLYLESKPELYLVDGSGKNIGVRLKRP